MFHTTNPVIKHKASLLNLAKKLSNVSKACKIMGVSHDTFYRYRELADEDGVNALINRSRRAPNLKNRTDALVCRTVRKRSAQTQIKKSGCKHTRFSSTHFLRFPDFRPSTGTPPVSGYSGIHEAARCCIPSASAL